MELFVFPSARFAAQCARAGIYSNEHAEIHLGSPKLWPYNVISPTTIEYGCDKQNHATGDYDTYLADGRVLAIGLASGEPSAGEPGAGTTLCRRL